MVHTREVGGKVLSFSHRGWLWNNAFLLYDHGTDSIWHHQTARAMAGPLRGTGLPRLRSSFMTFSAWRQLHPRTLVLPKPLDPKAEVERDVYADHNATLAYGLGVEVAGGERLYPFGELAGAVEDELAGVPLVVAEDPQARSAFAYDRRIGGRALTLELRASPDGPPVLVETGSKRAWALRTGRPVPGTGASEPLRALLTSHWERNAWIVQHPAARVWKP